MCHIIISIWNGCFIRRSSQWTIENTNNAQHFIHKTNSDAVAVIEHHVTSNRKSSLFLHQIRTKNSLELPLISRPNTKSTNLHGSEQNGRRGSFVLKCSFGHPSSLFSNSRCLCAPIDSWYEIEIFSMCFYIKLLRTFIRSFIKFSLKCFCETRK